MIDYRFLSPAEEEMSEAAIFYEAASTGFGRNFLDDVQQTIDRMRAHPKVGVEVWWRLKENVVASLPV